MRTQVAILDENMVFAHKLKHEIELVSHNLGLNMKISIFASSDDLRVSNDMYALFFVSIELSEYNGFEIVKKYKNSNKFQNVIFISGNKDSVFESFEYSPLSFIRREKLQEDLLRAMRIYKKRLLLKPARVAVPEGNRKLFLNVESICYIEGKSPYVEVYYDSGKTEVIRITTGDIDNILREYGFIRTKESCIVNSRYIESKKNKVVYLYNGKKFDISSKYKERVEFQLRNIIPNYQ